MFLLERPTATEKTTETTNQVPILNYFIKKNNLDTKFTATEYKIPNLKDTIK